MPIATNNIHELHGEVDFILKKLEHSNNKEIYFDIKKLIDKYPKSSVPLKLMAIALDRNCDYSRALLILNEALKIDPNDSEIYNNLATIFKKIKNYSEAIKFYDYAIKINPIYCDAYNNKGVLLHDSSNYNEAIINFKKAIEINPFKAEVYSNYGITLQVLGNISQAIEIFNKAIKIDPNLFQPNNNLANLYLSQMNDTKAKIYIEKSLSLNPNSSEVNYNIAVYSYLKNENKNAIKFLEIAKSLDGNNFIYNISHKILTANKTLANKNFDYVKLKHEICNDWINPLTSTPVKNLDFTSKIDARYGSGLCTLDFTLFQNSNEFINNIEKILIDKLKNEFEADIFICDSFVNIINNGGTVIHDHIRDHDKFFGLAAHKYSLVYYLDVGDQTSSKPGYLKIYDPDFEILPQNGDILIISASRKHSSIYDGIKDRVMIGVNFYIY